MALWDEVANRFSAEDLIALTNPDARTATSIDTTRRDSAVADAEAFFGIYAQTTYDNSNDTHVAVGVAGVVAILMSRGGSAPGVAEETVDKFIERLERLAKLDARKRLTPQAESNALEPTDEFAGDGTVRPEFDVRNFDDFRTGTRVTDRSTDYE